MSQIRIDGIVLDYIVDLVRASRDKSSAVFSKWVDFGASPRASLVHWCLPQKPMRFWRGVIL